MSVTRRNGHWALATVLAVAGLLGGCEYGEVQDPWASGEQYAKERERSAETWEQLRDRARYAQIDR